jgi:DNA-binding NarL/FixJ family response regulator
MPLRGVTILIIDDDSQARQQLSAALQKKGAFLLDAATGEQGLQKLLTHSIDVVLCDFLMPAHIGLAVIKRITELMPLLPVIVVSEQEEASDIAQAMHMGAWDYYLKTVTTPDALEHAILRSIKWCAIFEENQRNRQALERKNHELRETLSALEHDQRAGKEVQKSFLPKTPYRLLKYTFEYKLIASLYISGDFVDYFKLSDNKLFFYLADVSGHGASSAFVTILLKTAVMRMKRDLRRHQDNTLLSPAAFLRRINKEMMDLKLGKHITMIVGVLDKRERHLTYSVAGHLPLPILASDSKVEFLQGRGMPVGLFDEPIYSEQQMNLPASFELILFSDGVLEVIPEKTLLKKEQYLLNMIKGNAKTVDGMLEKLGINESITLPDDVAVMTIREIS